MRFLGIDSDKTGCLIMLSIFGMPFEYSTLYEYTAQKHSFDML